MRLIVFVLASLVIFLFAPTVFAATNYYVDCNSGNDSNSGTSEVSAWKSLSKANAANLLPADKLLFKRGCVWFATNPNYFNIRWIGTAQAPITIGAYGSGSKPMFRSNANGTSTYLTNIMVNGNYQVIENIAVDTINPHLDSTCVQTDGNPGKIGWYAGITVVGDHNTLQSIEASNMAIGVFFQDSSSSGKVLNSHFHDLNVLTRINTTAGSMGATGIFLHGDDHEVGFNLFERNAAKCFLADGNEQEYSAPIEVYNANRTYTHHNIAYGHRKHFEMGKDSAHVSGDNVLAYNLFVSETPRAVGVNIHGYDIFGPVLRTQIYHNTFVFTGANSQGIVAGGENIVKNNIFVAELKAAFYADTITESNNIYWDYKKTADNETDPMVQFSSNASQKLISPTSKKVDPLFLNSSVSGGNFHLTNSSPAKDMGTTITTSDNLLGVILSKDLVAINVPVGVGRDSGAHEYTSVSPTVTSTYTPTPTNVINADANSDGKVDGIDYMVWLNHYSSQPQNGFRDGDFNGDNLINVGDFSIWYGRYNI